MILRYSKIERLQTTFLEHEVDAKRPLSSNIKIRVEPKVTVIQNASKMQN